MSGRGQPRESYWAGLARKARSGRYGDIRLLALSLGILLLCVLGAILRAGSSAEAPTGVFTDTSAQAAASDTPSAAEPADWDTFSEETATEAQERSSTFHQRGTKRDISTSPSPQERKEMLREMRERIPEGEVIVF